MIGKLILNQCCGYRETWRRRVNVTPPPAFVPYFAGMKSYLPGWLRKMMHSFSETHLVM
jgi:hypothetical protein